MWSIEGPLKPVAPFQYYRIEGFNDGHQFIPHYAEIYKYLVEPMQGFPVSPLRQN